MTSFWTYDNLLNLAKKQLQLLQCDLWSLNKKKYVVLLEPKCLFE